MSNAEGSVPTVSISVHTLSEADAARATILLTKSSLRGIEEGDNVGHYIVIEQRDGTRVGLDLGNIGRVAIVRRGRGCQATVFGMLDSGDTRGAWSQFSICEGTEDPTSSALDGGGFVFLPFFVEHADGRKLRERLHVVLEAAPRRPLDGARPTLEAPRAFVNPKGQTEAARLLSEGACDVLRELGGVQGDLCRRRLVPLGATNPQNSYWDLGKFPEGAGIKRFGFRFTPSETELDKESGLYMLRSSVIDTEDDPDTDRAAWKHWRFHSYANAMRSRSDMTLTGLGLLFNALDEVDA